MVRRRSEIYQLADQIRHVYDKNIVYSEESAVKLMGCYVSFVQDCLIER